MSTAIDVSGGSGAVLDASGPVSSDVYGLARLGLGSTPSSHGYLMFLTELLEGASAGHRGLAWSAAGGPAGDAACFYSLTGSGGSWVLHEYAAPAAPQDRVELAARTEAPAAEELRTVALTLPTGYASMTCHDVAVVGSNVYVLAEVSDSSYLLRVAMGTFTNTGQYETNDAVPGRGALGVDGGAAAPTVLPYLVRAYLSGGAVRLERYDVDSAPAWAEGWDVGTGLFGTEVLGFDAVPGSGPVFSGGTSYIAYRTAAGSLVRRDAPGGLTATWALADLVFDIRAFAYDWPRGYWHEGYLPGSYIAAFTALARPA
jgi:hypothetical protein